MVIKVNTKSKLLAGGIALAFMGISVMLIGNCSSKIEAATTGIADVDEAENYISDEELQTVNERMTDEAFKAICQANLDGLTEAGSVLGEADRSEYIRFFIENGYISRATLGL